MSEGSKIELTSRGLVRNTSMKKMTLAEMKIIEWVTRCNQQGVLAGLGTSPNDSYYGDRQHRFVKRLADAGKIVWVRTALRGSGWTLAGSEMSTWT